jgi:holliday junction DNA helicase RuvA
LIHSNNELEGIMKNGEIARKLRERALELAREGDNLYRVRAFRQAALAVMGLPREAEALVSTGGPRVLENVPGIGKSLSETIANYALN